jgi:hypothetical protein
MVSPTHFVKEGWNNTIHAKNLTYVFRTTLPVILFHIRAHKIGMMTTHVLTLFKHEMDQAYGTELRTFHR